jgi:exonuclease III
VNQEKYYLTLQKKNQVKEQYQSLKIFHQNVQHLASRLNILNINLEEIQPHIIALSEHKLSKEEIIYLNIHNYRICSYYTRNNTSGGGVIILVCNGIKSKKLSIPAIDELIMEKEFECCLSQISVNDFSFVLVCVYRTPQQCFIQPFLDKFDILCEIL